MRHAILLLSGGLDSYTAGAIATADGFVLNALTVRMDGDRIDLTDRSVDGGIDPGSCEPGAISPAANAWIVQAFCPRTGMTALNVELGEREDAATIDVPLAVVVLGGPGSDVLRTGASRGLDAQCQRLVDLALERGGPDNITALLARYKIP